MMDISLKPIVIMKLAYIINTLNGTSGIIRMVTLQANYFISNYGYDIDFILLQQSPKEITFFYDLNCKVNLHFINRKRNGVKHTFQKLKLLNKILNKINPTIVMPVESNFFSLYLPYFTNSRFKYIYQRHDTKERNLKRLSGNLKISFGNTLKIFLLNLAGHKYDKFVILSDAHRADWKNLNNLIVIENPLTINDDRRKARLDKKIVLAIGRSDPIKGFDMLLKSWSIVTLKYPDWRLKIVGVKATDNELKKQIDKLGINNSVEVQMPTKNIESIYLNSSIYVCSSRLEGFPLILLEAMSFGIPVISFDCKYGPSEIISDGIDGLLVPPNDTNVLATSIIRLIEDDKLRSEFGDMAYNNIQRYSKENIMLKWKDLFESIV
ncbi:glycosyltransferase family 4 protein [Winogradskyella sp. KYW1333]|nr:glycosyltransferase family 4 protein [Winogradskyella sp. KYW1333]